MSTNEPWMFSKINEGVQEKIENLSVLHWIPVLSRGLEEMPLQPPSNLIIPILSSKGTRKLSKVANRTMVSTTYSASQDFGPANYTTLPFISKSLNIKTEHTSH